MPRMAQTSDSPGKPNRSGAATRAKIIDAAIDVLTEKGISGFTLQAVADRAGIFYGNVTHHYATRDKLVDAMLEAVLRNAKSVAGLPATTEADHAHEQPGRLINGNGATGGGHVQRSGPADL